MSKSWHKIVLFWTSLLAHCGADIIVRPGEHFEICEGETFKLTCPVNHVIVMRRARYGRMEVGRCLSSKAEVQLGCAADLLKYLDSRCSGESECQLKVGASLESEATPSTWQCTYDVRKYLDAEYECLQVKNPTDYNCHLPISIPVTSDGMQIVQSFVTVGGCEVINLHADAGQSLNISLWDFSKVDTTGYFCSTQYGTVSESSRGRTVDICRREGRKSQIFQSESHEVQLLLDRTRINQNLKFMITAVALGCEDLPTVKGAWSERKVDDLTIRCYDSKNTWKLRCNNHRWIGVMGNCTSSTGVTTTVQSEEDILFTNAVLITLICSVSAVVCTIIVMIGIICLRRWSLQERRTLNQIVLETQNRQLLGTLRQEPVYALYDSIPAKRPSQAPTLPARHRADYPPPSGSLIQGFDEQGKEIK